MKLRDGFALGGVAVYPLEGRLEYDGQSRRIQPKAMDVLLQLAEADGNVVTRDELLRNVWDDRAVTDEPLTRCIGELRRSLGDNREDPRFILTIPKRGYRLLQPVVAAPGGQQAVRVTDPASPGPGQTRRRGGTLPKLLTGIGILVLAVLLPIGIDELWKPAIDETSRGSGTAAKSIVVLPLVDMSASGENEYFADGMSEELLNVLAGIPELRVISRTSAFSFKGKDIDLGSIAAQLNVSYALEGSVRKSGDRVRIKVQLVDARRDSQLWSDTYERTLDDIFAVQDEIAASVMQQLEIELLDRPAPLHRTDPEAYALALQARYLVQRVTPSGLETAIALLHESLAIDPDYAMAHAMLAEAYDKQANQGLRPYAEGYGLAREAAGRALRLDSRIALAHRTLGRIARNYDRQFEIAAMHYLQAVDIAPKDSDVLAGAANMAVSLGRVGQGVLLARKAVEYDPVNPNRHMNLGLAYLFAGQFDEAVLALRRTLTLSPGFIGVNHSIGIAHLLNTETEKALAFVQQESYEPWRLVGLAIVNHALGRADESDAALADLLGRYREQWSYNIAYVFAYRGEADRAFEWLEMAASRHDPGLSGIAVEPMFDKVREDPRWPGFLARIGKTPTELAAIEFDVPQTE